MSTPTLAILAAAAQNSYHTGVSTSAGLSVFKDADGKPMTVTTANGCTATAYQDTLGHVIVAFQGTSTDAQHDLDNQIVGGDSPSAIAGYADALAFTRQVEQAAGSAGVPASDVSVTGHSLGGALAEFVASKTGLAGASFAGCGIPGYVNISHAANFVSYVESGDPFANFGTDTKEAAIVKMHTAHEDHYGTVVQIGSAKGAASIATLVANVQKLPLEALFGREAQAMHQVVTEIARGMAQYHGIPTYMHDIAALPVGAAGSASYVASMSGAAASTHSLATIAASVGGEAVASYMKSAGLSMVTPPHIGASSDPTVQLSGSSSSLAALASLSSAHAAVVPSHLF